jgi:hypothetical protein
MNFKKFLENDLRTFGFNHGVLNPKVYSSNNSNNVIGNESDLLQNQIVDCLKIPIYLKHFERHPNGVSIDFTVDSDFNIDNANYCLEKDNIKIKYHLKWWKAFKKIK